MLEAWSCWEDREEARWPQAVPSLAGILAWGSAERFCTQKHYETGAYLSIFCGCFLFPLPETLRDKDLKAKLFGAPGEEVLLGVNSCAINHFQNLLPKLPEYSI